MEEGENPIVFILFFLTELYRLMVDLINLTEGRGGLPQI